MKTKFNYGKIFLLGFGFFGVSVIWFEQIAVLLDDIEYALNEGQAKTIDDIRRDFRVGMGPCQGGFCTVRVAGIWHDVKDRPIEQTNVALRDFFEVDARYIALAALQELAAAGEIEASVVKKAVADLKIDPGKLNPHTD